MRQRVSGSRPVSRPLAGLVLMLGGLVADSAIGLAILRGAPLCNVQLVFLAVKMFHTTNVIT